MKFSLRTSALFVCLLYSTICEADFTQNLNSGWSFRQVAQPSAYLPATVPGTVHTDLFANGIIPDPFFGNNETKLQWIDSKTWEYTMTFECSRSMRSEKHLELQFEGLDTYADVYLNDTLLFTAEDMFLSYTKDVKKYITAKNTLRIVFHPASELIEKNKSLSSIKKYPGGDRVFIRKAQYQFGWDWGPRFVTCGIWKPVRLAGWSGMRISDAVYKLDYLDKDTAYMVVDFMFEADKSTAYQFLVFQNDTGIYSDFYSVTKNKPEHLKIAFKVPHPRLWWCNGLGEPNLYRFAVAAIRGKKTSVVVTTTGIRKIELSTDRVDNDGGFYFILNDVPVFAMGSNWIPSDNFIPRVKQEKIAWQLNDMQQLNMNMVRVWGGGIYESDYFYSKCDSLGLMVWQDLPFACSMYPYATLDRNNLLMKEVTDNQRRIASHPSIALWCGDNENREGWFNWGWQKEMGYSIKDSAEIYNEYFNYQVKFLGALQYMDPFFPFVMTSPQNGWGRKEAYTQGDVHYWGVWWGMERFTSYETHTGRFVSEFGFQGCPSVHTFRELGFEASQFSWWFTDSAFVAHQKHPTGYQTIDTYMERDYGITPNTFDDYVYLSQVLQRDAMTTAIEAQRRNMPTCMGSLFWQYNDCWPVTSWSVQDYYGRKKLAWYALKRVYDPVLLSFEETRDSVYLWIANSTSHEGLQVFSVNWTSFSGANKYSVTREVNLVGNSSQRYWSISKKQLFDSLPATEGVLNAKIVRLSFRPVPQLESTTHLFGKEVDHNYPVAQPKYSFVRYIKEGPMAFTISSPVYLHHIMIICDDPNTSFSDNGFDLLPGESRKIDVTTTLTETELIESLEFHSMNDLVGAEKRKAESQN